MTSSFVKVVFADLQGFRLFFSSSRECAYSNAHTVSCEKIIYDINTGVTDGHQTTVPKGG